MSKKLIRNMFSDLFENMTFDENLISRYMSPNYVQHVNTETLNYSDFVNHMRKQKEQLKSAKVTIERCVSSEDAVFTIHRINAIKKDNSEVVGKVIAYFKIENGKIVLCDEMTQVLKGSKEDEQLGSCR